MNNNNNNISNNNTNYTATDTRAKTVADSRTESSKILFPSHMNGGNRLYGGQLLMWIDELAGIVGRRHCEGMVTTASIDQLNFIAPAHADDVLILDGCLTHVGNSSMEVRVDTYTEQYDGSRTLINTAYLNLVALDSQDHPMTVPRLNLVTQQERVEWDAAVKRIELRKTRAANGY